MGNVAGRVVFLELYKRDGFFSDLEMQLCAGYLAQRGYQVQRLKWWLPGAAAIPGAAHPFGAPPALTVAEGDLTQLRQLVETFQPDVVLVNRYLVTNLGTWFAREFPGLTLALLEHNRDHAYPDVPVLLELQHPPLIEALVHRARTGQTVPVERFPPFEGYWDHYSPLLEYQRIGEAEGRQEARAIMLTEGGCPFRADVRKNPLFDGLSYQNTEEELRGCSFCYEAGDPHVIQGAKLLALARQQLETLQRRQPPPQEYSFDGLRLLAFLPELAQIILDVRPVGKRFLFAPRVDTITQNLKGLRRALELLAGTGYQLVFHLIGFENFAQRELDIYNKGVDVSENYDAIRIIREMERDFPAGFESTGYSSHGFLMFNPWTRIEDLAVNSVAIRETRFEDFRERPWLTKLRLVPAQPLYAMAKRDGLIAEGYADAALDTSRAHGYMQETAWRFQHPEVERVFRWTHRLLGYGVTPADQQLRRRLGLSEPDLFAALVSLFQDPQAAAAPDDAIPTMLLHAVSGQSLAGTREAGTLTGTLLLVRCQPRDRRPGEIAELRTAGLLRERGAEVTRWWWFVGEDQHEPLPSDDLLRAADLRGLAPPPTLIALHGAPTAAQRAWFREAYPNTPQFDASGRGSELDPAALADALFAAEHQGVGLAPEELAWFAQRPLECGKPAPAELIGAHHLHRLDQVHLLGLAQAGAAAGEGSLAAWITEQLRALADRRPIPAGYRLDWADVGAELPAVAVAWRGSEPPGLRLTVGLDSQAPPPPELPAILDAALAQLGAGPYRLAVEGLRLGLDSGGALTAIADLRRRWPTFELRAVHVDLVTGARDLSEVAAFLDYLRRQGLTDTVGPTWWSASAAGTSATLPTLGRWIGRLLATPNSPERLAVSHSTGPQADLRCLNALLKALAATRSAPLPEAAFLSALRLFY